MGQKHSSIPDEMLHRLRTETKFTENELSLWYKEFMKDNPTGTISRTDLKLVYNYIFPFSEESGSQDRENDKGREQMFTLVEKIFDDNGDGNIDFVEFVRGVALVSGGCYFEDRLKFAFKFFDRNNNGLMDLEEMRKLVECVDAMHKDTDREYKGTPYQFNERVKKLYDEFNVSFNTQGISLKDLLSASNQTEDPSFVAAFDLFSSNSSSQASRTFLNSHMTSKNSKGGSYTYW